MLNLVTGGCSFTHGNKTWTLPLSKALNAKLYNVGIGSASNETISRRVIWQVDSLLNSNINPEEVLVGVMWSGFSRQSFYFPFKKQYKNTVKEITNKSTNDIEKINPNKWPRKDVKGVWCLATTGMDNHYINQYYRHYNNDIQSLIYTYEAVLKLQWYLKLKNIKYFFTGYTTYWNDDNSKHIQIDYLKNMIDYDYFITDTEYEWVLKNSKHPWRNNYPNDRHPSVEQHQDYANRVLLPFIKEKLTNTTKVL